MIRKIQCLTTHFHGIYLYYVILASKILIQIREIQRITLFTKHVCDQRISLF